MNQPSSDDDAKVRGAHCERFRNVSTRYPRRVAEAYGGDIARAAADDDETVAATVAAWERSRGIPVRDWVAVGQTEGRGTHG